MTRLKHLFSFILLVLFTYLAFTSLRPKEVTGEDAPSTVFSTARALTHLKAISEKPHFVGSEAHNEVRDYLLKTLEDMGLSPQVQEGFTYSQWRGQGSLVKPKNILARIKGSGDGKAVLLLSHYDSAPHSSSYGASDAGSGVVTILESVRAYLASGQIPKNDIIICFTDAEELGLYGASLFVKNHPWAKDVGVALNFEARGSGGPSNMIVETNGGNAHLIKGFKEANTDYPVATSLMYSIYKLLPNDTDSTVLREGGDIDGFFFAFIDDHYDYHTRNDTYENLDPETLEHQGSYLLPLLTYYAQADLNAVKTTEDEVYFDTAVFKFISYPFTWIWPMLILAVFIFVVLLRKGFKKRVLRARAIGKGFATFFFTLIVGTTLFFGLWELIKFLYPSYKAILPVFIYNGHWYIAAFAALALSFCLGIYHRWTHPKQTPSLMVAPLTVWLLINILIAIYLPGAAYFIIPVFFGLLSFFMVLRQAKPSNTLLALLCAPALFLFAPLVQFFPVGLGPQFLAASTMFLTLLFGLLLPVVGVYRAKKGLAYLSLLLGVFCLIAAHYKAKATVERPTPNSLVFYQDTATQKAYWATYDAQPDPWVQSYIGTTPQEAKEVLTHVAYSKYRKSYTFVKETTSKELPPPYICIEKDTLIGTEREITMVIEPQRKTHQLRLYSPVDTPFLAMAFNGQEVKPDSTETLYKKRKQAKLMTHYISDQDSLAFRFRLPQGVSPDFTVETYSLDLLTHPKFTMAARPAYTMPLPFVVNDAVITKHKFNLGDIAKIKKDTISIE